MLRGFLKSPKYLKLFIVLLYIISESVWLLIFRGDSWLFLIIPVFIIPLSVIVSALIWRVLNTAVSNWRNNEN